MIEKHSFLFQYLKKEQINIDEYEFIFQFESHPDYPSLLAISDTLSFFNIPNRALKVLFPEVELLPETFIALINRDNGRPFLSFVLRKGDYFICTTEDSGKPKVLSKNELASKWGDIIFLLEKDENFKEVIKNRNYPILVLIALCIILFYTVIYMASYSITSTLFGVFPSIGFLFSFAALKDLFGTKSDLLDNFCHITPTSGCESVIGSTKWKIFEILSFSDLSITFFATQIIALLLMSLSNNVVDYFAVQAILLMSSFPVIFLSLYYQKFVEKKWCPICLSIITVILLEVIYVLSLSNNLFALSNFGILIFLFVYVANLAIWFPLKSLFIMHKELKELKLRSNRFQRNFKLFKNILFSNQKIDLPNNPVLLGNKNSNLHITILTSPFCGHCNVTHDMMENIYNKHREDLSISIIFKIDIDSAREDSKLLFRNLVAIHLEKGDIAFNNALKSWFENKNFKQWLATYGSSNLDIRKIDSILTIHNSWCIENQITFTPAIFIQGHQYPEMYDRKDLIFFINDLIEDSY